jgi:hypothetical protein
MWWTRAADVPPLVTTSSPQFNGILGTGDTRALVAGPFGQTFHSGVRVGAVRWFGDDDCQCRGIETRLFFLGEASSGFTATTGQYPLLARPFINVNPAEPGSFSEVVAAVGRANGGVSVQLQNQVWGAEVNYRRNLFNNGCARVDAIVGYRFLDVKESLGISENFNNPGVSFGGVPAVSGTVIDSFKTENQFHGGQIGLVGEIKRGRWSIDGRASVAFGSLTRTADIAGGQQFILANGAVMNVPGGLLAIPGTNIGKFTDNVFAVVPEVGLNVNYQLTSRLKLFVGYNFLYLGDALRPGDVIDPYVDAARIPNFALAGHPLPVLTDPLHPHPQFKSSGFFVQGISFGLVFTW